MGSLFTWQQHLLGIDHFPSSLTDFEVEYFFSFNDEELRQIKSRRPHLQLGAAIQLGFIKMTGSTLNASERIPLGVMFQLSDTLRTQKIHIATTRSLYPRRSTLYEHQAWATQCLGWHPFTSARRGTLVREITKRLAECPLAIDGIVELLKTWLYQRSILIPAARSLRALAVRLYRITEREAQRVALEEIPPHIVDGWIKDILRRHEDIPTQLEWLQRIPRGRSYNTLSATLQRIAYLKHLGVYLVPLKRLSASTQRYYAYRLRNRRPSRLRTMPVDRARLELVCFLSITLIDTTDRAIALFDFQATDLRRRALKRVHDSAIEHDKILRDAFLELHKLCHDETVNDGDFRSQFKLIAPDIYRTIMPKAERVRQELVNDHRRVNALVRIMDNIFLQGTLASSTAELRNAMSKSPSKQTQPTTDIPPVWQSIYDASSSKQKQHVLGAVTLVSMQRELRNGSLWASNGYVYRDRNALFIEQSQWQRERSTWHRQLNLPVSFAHYQRRLSSALTRGLDDLAQAVANGELSLDQDGIHVKHLAGEHEEPIVSKTRKAIFREIGGVQLPDMIISIDQSTPICI